MRPKCEGGFKILILSFYNTSHTSIRSDSIRCVRIELDSVHYRSDNPVTIYREPLWSVTKINQYNLRSFFVCQAFLLSRVSVSRVAYRFEFGKFLEGSEGAKRSFLCRSWRIFFAWTARRRVCLGHQGRKIGTLMILALMTHCLR